MKTAPTSQRSRAALLLFVGGTVIASLSGYGGTKSQAEIKELPLSGINTGWQDFSYLGASIPFCNVLKSGSAWYGPKVATDRNGYPLELGEGEEVAMYVFRDNQRHYPLGDYTLMWEGEGQIEIRTAGRSIRFGPEDEKKQIVPIEAHSDYGIQVVLSWTPKGKHLRNLRLYLPGYDENSGIWTRHYLEDLKPYGLIRICWGSGVWSFTEVERWEERRWPGEYHWMSGDYEHGIPYEAMAELANETGNDLWVCVPHKANEDYLRKMAELFRERLHPELRLWIEYTNEHWLDIDFFKIPPNDYFQEMLELHEGDPAFEDVTVSHYYGRRALEVFKIFEEVFAEKGQEGRLMTVLSGSSSYSTYLEQAAGEIDRLGGMDYVDALSVGPYFGHVDEDHDHFTPTLDKGWDAIFESVHRTVEEKFDPEAELGREMHENAALAVKYDKFFVAYESGQHYTTWTGAPGHIIAPMNRHPEMYDVYRRYLDNWMKLPNAATMVMFQAASLYNEYEAFGLREYYDQPVSELHKRRAVLDWIESEGRE